VWTSLRRPCTDFLLARWRSDHDLRRYYGRTILPEESIVQTWLANAGRFALRNDNRRYIDFTGSRDGHPRVLTLADLPELARGAWHLARKFDLAVDRQVLDRLDERLFA